jgi:hypothetical protein
VTKPRAPLPERVHKAIRDGAPAAREWYAAAKKAGAFVRDRRRRAILRALPPSAITIPRDAGFVMFPAGALAGVDAVVTAARDALASFDASRKPASKKRFLVNVLDRDALTLASPIVSLALREDVLAAVARYLDVAPVLTSVSVFHSDTVDGAPSSSQLYHCDADDITQVKIFVYCSDVDAASGPFTLLDAATTARVQQRTGYKYSHRLTDDQVRSAGGAPDRPILGRAGTAAFIDTSRCLHFGSRVARDAAPRLVVMIQYQTPYSFMLPFDYRSAAPLRRLIDPSLTALQRLALGE